jgi:hypothetical protein
VLARRSPVKRVVKFWGSRGPSDMPRVLLVAWAWKLYRNHANSIRGSVLAYLGWSWSSGLLGSLCFHTSDSGNLSIIVSYPFTSFMSFVYYISYSRIGYCFVIYMFPHLRTIERSGTWCGDCYLVPQRPLPWCQVEGPRHSNRRGVGGYHLCLRHCWSYGILCGTRRSDSPIRAS